MATGQSESGDAIDFEAGRLTERLEQAAFLTVLARPRADQIATAAAIERLVATPVHVRVLDGQRQPPATPEGLIVTTDPGIEGADVDLDAHGLAASVDAIAGASGHTAPPWCDAVLAGPSVDPAPGLVTPFDSLAESISRSVRVFTPLSGMSLPDVASRLEEAGFPESVDSLATDDTLGRRVAAWVSALVCESPTRPPSAAAAVSAVCRPQYLADAAVPTREGLVDAVDVMAEVAPGATVAALTSSTDWASLLDRYREAVDAIIASVEDLPVDRAGPVVAADTPEGAPSATVRLWTQYRLHEPYGLLASDDDPAVVALCSTGDRSAGALLEGTASRLGGTYWGDATVARGRIDADRSTIRSTITEQL